MVPSSANEVLHYHAKHPMQPYQPAARSPKVKEFTSDTKVINKENT